MAEIYGSQPHIRALGRGLDVLRIVSLHGPITTAQIAKWVDLPYPTVNRMVNTLIAEGYVEREPDRKHFRVAGLVQSLSHGYHYDSQIVKITRKHLVELTKNFGWVTVLATRLGSSMVARDSTHVLTSLTFNHYYPGFTFPILDSSSGLAYLAFASDGERDSCLRGIQIIEGRAAEHAIEVVKNSDALNKIRQVGFATRGGNSTASQHGKNSSIAVPIMHGNEVSGALCLVFFAAAMSIDEAVKLYSSRLMDVAKTIGAELALNDKEDLLEND